MQKNFLDSFDEFIRERVYEIENDVVRNDVEYIELSEESEKVFKDIQKFVPEEFKEKLSHYENLNGLISGVSDDLMYRQGFNDGIKMLYSLIVKSLV